MNTFTAGILPLLLLTHCCACYEPSTDEAFLFAIISDGIVKDTFVLALYCCLDKFEASKGFNGCFSKAWFYWQISNSTSSKTTGKNIFLLNTSLT